MADSLVERRSIDVVPDAERHGTAFSQFTLWLGANLQITAVVTGALAVVFGGDVVWPVVGLLLGNVLGGAVMALHSAQGPKLGLPQMIQSRAQFGVRGAVVPLLLVILMYVGFFASGSVLAGQATAELTHTDDTTGIVLFAAVTAVMAAVGYRVIHALGRVASVICALAFLYLGIRLLDRVDLSALLSDAHFDLPMFLLAVSLSASWQLAFGPYVADYSRYLPRTTSGRATFWWTLSGSALGAMGVPLLIKSLGEVDDVRGPGGGERRRGVHGRPGRVRRGARRHRSGRLLPDLQGALRHPGPVGPPRPLRRVALGRPHRLRRRPPRPAPLPRHALLHRPAGGPSPGL